MAHEPLYRPDLREIQNRNLDNPDVLTLLREIKRLRELIVRAAQLLLRWGEMTPATQEGVEYLSHELEVEPCVEEADYEDRKRSQNEIARRRNTQGPEPGAGRLWRRESRN